MKYWILSILGLLFAQERGYCQENDGQLWTAFGFQYSINQQWDVALTQQLRWKDWVQQFSKYNSELSIAYHNNKSRWLDPFSINTGFRHSLSQDKGIFSYSLRFFMDLKAQFKSGVFKWGFRYRVQQQGAMNDSWWEERAMHRLKQSLSYAIPKTKLRPGLAFESFFRNSSTINDQFIRYRCQLFLFYQLNPALRLQVFTAVEPTYFLMNSRMRFISCFRLKYYFGPLQQNPVQAP